MVDQTICLLLYDDAREEDSDDSGDGLAESPGGAGGGGVHPEVELEVLRHERREADDAEEHENGGEAVEDVDLVPEESFAAVHGVLEELFASLGRVDLLLVHLVHPLLVGVLAAGQGLQGQDGQSGSRKMEEETKERHPNCVTSVEEGGRKEKQTTTEFDHCTVAAHFTTALI